MNLSKFVFRSYFEFKKFTSCEKFCSAFTLAEVLITLGVIGVVAAMTLPMLMENYERIIVETRLKKFYTVMNQAILRSVAANGPYEGWGYWVPTIDVNGVMLNQQESVKAKFELYFAPYLNVHHVKKELCPNANAGGAQCYHFYLADGSAFAYSSGLSRTFWYYPKGDVSKCKRAFNNIWGRCGFVFAFQPIWTEDTQERFEREWKFHKNKGLEPFMYIWDGKDESLMRGATYSCATNGLYCAALIQRNGWRIPKNYPYRVRY